MKSRTKIEDAYRVIRDILSELNPSIIVNEHRIDKEYFMEYFNIKILIPQYEALVVIREYWQQNKLEAYGYYFRVRDYDEWWDNRPHHREVETYPHHRHIEGKILPLYNPSLKSFLERVKLVLLRKACN